MFRVRRSQVEAADAQGSGVQPCLSSIRVRLVNEEGEPYPEQLYKATLTNGQRDDMLDRNGGSWHRYIPPGQCTYDLSGILKEVQDWTPPAVEAGK
ncbi:MAG TPA: hypothetical protein VLS89_19330 [Candidatus Nanopelagicales bacterium]|nr:hypothetical protein [Candidatus Nanopelagicales bacterium]